MRKAVFLDRDGTINREVDVLRRLSQLKIFSGSAKAIKSMRDAGFLVIIITNQPVIARGWLKEKELRDIHKVLLARLAKQGAKIDAIYYCPHHPNANLKKYRKVCACRKPKPGMILQAVKRFKIDKKKSFMVGDHAWDILAGQSAGLKTILVTSSKRSKDPAHKNVQADFTVKNLVGAAKIIKQHGAK